MTTHRDLEVDSRSGPEGRVGTETIRIRGVVQGVGFRPTVARVARRLALDGWVRNDAEGVLVALAGPKAERDGFLEGLLRELPPLAKLASVERSEGPVVIVGRGFRIVESAGGRVRTAVSPDAATCDACRSEIREARGRRYRYPFTNCTHCGPRFSIVTGIPYDRRNTTMAPFPLCAECQAEYADTFDRRFHAEPIACPRCGPRVTLSPADRGAPPWRAAPAHDVLHAVADLLRAGAIVAIKALGGYHLCCDATREDSVQRLRARKRRPSKPLALMANDVRMVERYCAVNPLEREALLGHEAPVVLLERRGDADVARSVAPGQRTLGFMLPSTPLHDLILAGMQAPIVCTSGNLSEEPPCTGGEEARERLGAVADWFLDHDRPIAVRIDDSVAKLADGAVRLVRRARGYAPAPLALPPGFERAASVLATGAQSKNALCLLGDGSAVLSQHLGDLDEPRTVEAWAEARRTLSELYQHAPERVAVDMHPDYVSTRLGLALAEERGIPALAVQHHHAHVAACMCEHGVPRGAPPVLGIALDGLGYGDDGAFWGGEFLIATYGSYVRVGTFKPVGLIGGDRAAEEPWRSLYAQLAAAMDPDEVRARFGHLDAIRFLDSKPRPLLDRVLDSPVLAPRASSCGRLFDAAAALLGLHRDRVDHDGQAAMALEQAATPDALAASTRDRVYPIDVGRLPGGLPCLDPARMWRAMLEDLAAGAALPLLSARFHVALAEGVARLARQIISERSAVDTVALSGGVWQNRILLELVAPRLRAAGVRVLVPRLVPPNDGGIALGQAMVAAARSLSPEETCA